MKRKIQLALGLKTVVIQANKKITMDQSNKLNELQDITKKQKNYDHNGGF